MDIRIAVAAACTIVVCMSLPALAATGADSQFPNRPVRFIVPSSPGGGLDVYSRIMAHGLDKRWGQAVVVDNRGGASGLIGSELGARAAPDGYTLTLVSVGIMLPVQLSGALSFERGRDFTPIARSTTSALLLVVHPGVPAKSVKELVELARAKPRYLNYASGGAGGMPHLAMELFAAVAGIQMAHVPYKGTGPSIPDLLSGRVQLVLTSVATFLPHVQAGRLRALAITGAKRGTSLPEVPTFAEAGYPGYDASLWFGVFGPARMPASLVARLNGDFNWVAQQPETVNRFAGAGMDPYGGLSPAQFADFVATDLVNWNRAFKAAGVP